MVLVYRRRAFLWCRASLEALSSVASSTRNLLGSLAAGIGLPQVYARGIDSVANRTKCRWSRFRGKFLRFYRQRRYRLTTAVPLLSDPGCHRRVAFHRRCRVLAKVGVLFMILAADQHSGQLSQNQSVSLGRISVITSPQSATTSVPSSR